MVKKITSSEQSSGFILSPKGGRADAQETELWRQIFSVIVTLEL